MEFHYGLLIDFLSTTPAALDRRGRPVNDRIEDLPTPSKPRKITSGVSNCAADTGWNAVDSSCNASPGDCSSGSRNASQSASYSYGISNPHRAGATHHGCRHSHRCASCGSYSHAIRDRHTAAAVTGRSVRPAFATSGPVAPASTIPAAIVATADEKNLLVRQQGHLARPFSKSVNAFLSKHHTLPFLAKAEFTKSDIGLASPLTWRRTCQPHESFAQCSRVPRY